MCWTMEHLFHSSRVSLIGKHTLAFSWTLAPLTGNLPLPQQGPRGEEQKPSGDNGEGCLPSASSNTP